MTMVQREWHNWEYDIQGNFPDARIVWARGLELLYISDMDGRYYLIYNGALFFHLLRSLRAHIPLAAALGSVSLEGEKWIAVMEFGTAGARERYIRHRFQVNGEPLE